MLLIWLLIHRRISGPKSADRISKIFGHWPDPLDNVISRLNQNQELEGWVNPEGPALNTEIESLNVNTNVPVDISHLGSSWTCSAATGKCWRLCCSSFLRFSQRPKNTDLKFAYGVGRWWWSPVWRTRRRVFWGALGITEQPGLERNINPNPRIYHLPTYVNLRLLNNVYHEVDISLPKCKLDRN